jgi:hypothetical protein
MASVTQDLRQSPSLGSKPRDKSSNLHCGAYAGILLADSDLPLLSRRNKSSKVALVLTPQALYMEIPGPEKEIAIEQRNAFAVSASGKRCQIPPVLQRVAR